MCAFHSQKCEVDVQSQIFSSNFTVHGMHPGSYPIKPEWVQCSSHISLFLQLQTTTLANGEIYRSRDASYFTILHWLVPHGFTYQVETTANEWVNHIHVQIGHLTIKQKH